MNMFFFTIVRRGDLTKFLLSGFYLFGLVMLSNWSISFGEIFGAGNSAVFQLSEAVLFTFIIGAIQVFL